ncbi:hypothetical protein [Prolixibacter bellariivorans]|nr:hypothetical protein [Prolixibacter bellariivorans]
MIRKAILIIAIQLSVLSTLYAQSLSEQIGGIKTHFQLYSLTTNLDASEQMLVLRAETKHYSDETYAAGWGFGYRSYHLEFITQKELNDQRLPYSIGKARYTRLKLTFYNANKDILASFMIPFERVDRQSNPSAKGGPFFYSIDLINIPLVLLGQTAAIDMVEMVANRK